MTTPTPTAASIRSDRLKGIASIVASAFGFAVMALCVRLCDDYGGPVSSFQKSFFRNAVALTLALAVLLREEGRAGFRLPSARGGAILLLRAALGTVGLFANFYALGKIPIAEGQTLNKTAPFFTVVCAWLFLRERVTRRQALALCLAFVGVLFIAKPGFAGDAAFPLFIGLLGGVCAGAAYACVRALRTHGVSSSFIIFFFSVFSCLAAIPFMLHHVDPMTPAQLLILVGAGAGAAVGQFGVTLAYGYAAPREIAVYDYTNILFTAAFGFLFFGQTLDAASVFGVFAILLAAFCLKI